MHGWQLEIARQLERVLARLARLETQERPLFDVAVTRLWVWNETPSGAINGANVTFTLAHAPVAGTLRLYQNGLRLAEGVGNDYTLSGATITMAIAPVTGDRLLADYVY